MTYDPARVTTPKLADMQAFTFGVEIETIHLSREKIARTIATVTGGTVAYLGEGYDKWTCTLADGRKWTAMSDNSITGGRNGMNGEVVTPICTYADLETIQAVARALHAAGARTDASCGIHVHVGASAEQLPPDALGRLAKLVYQQEALLFEALTVQDTRRGQWCKPVNEATMATIKAHTTTSRAALQAAWYGRSDSGSYASTQHYHPTRYHGLNLHSVFYRGTVEFRYFEATLHAGKIKAYVQLCLAMAAKAKLAKGAVARKRTFDPTCAKYDMRVFLLRLGMIGDEFKSARTHLLDNMKGNATYKRGKKVAPVTSPETTERVAVALYQAAL